MIKHCIVIVTRYLLSKVTLSTEDSALLTTMVLDKLGALPFCGIIGLNEDGMLAIKGQEVSVEQAKNLRESAHSAINNTALNLVMEQITFLAVTHGVHKAETVAQMYWGRVGIWICQKIRDSLLELAQKKELDL